MEPKEPLKDQGVINKLQGKLYSRKQKIDPYERRTLPSDTHSVQSDWDVDDRPKRPSFFSRKAPRAISSVEKSRRSIIKILLIASVVFFIFSSVVSAILFFGGSNIVSARNIDIEISGPVSIEGGQELVLQIGLVNRNSIPLELADLIIEYPDGTRTPGNLNAELPRTRESLGVLESGERVKKTARAILFGEENSPQKILVTLEYRIEGSNAIFVKEATYDIILSSAPIALRVQGLEEVVSGQEVEFSVELFSNSTQSIDDVLLVAEYPQGFEVTRSDPKPTFETSVWELGTLEPKTKKTITLRGVVVGQNEEKRIVRFNVGVQNTTDERELAATFATQQLEFSIKRPFIDLAVGVNGDASTADTVVQGGASVRADIKWQNNLPTKIIDGEIVVTLSGDAYDRRSVRASNGFYDSNTNTIRWTSETIPALKEIAPGAGGQVSFEVKTFGLSDKRGNNLTFLFDSLIRGRRINETNVPEEIQSIVTRKARVQTDLIFASRALYSAGPFENSGAVPPKAENKTTYTVLWSVGNSVNDLSNVQVVATIPSYVEWLGVVSPLGDAITYNPVGGRVTWNVDNVAAGVGTQTKSREIYFQVAITPSISQVDETPVLVGSPTVSGFDTFTNTKIQSQGSATTVELVGDSVYGKGNGKVIP